MEKAANHAGFKKYTNTQVGQPLLRFSSAQQADTLQSYKATGAKEMKKGRKTVKHCCASPNPPSSRQDQKNVAKSCSS